MTPLKKAMLPTLFAATVMTAGSLLLLLDEHIEDDEGDKADLIGWVAGTILYPALWLAHILPGDTSRLRAGALGFIQFCVLYGFFLWLWLRRGRTGSNTSGTECES